MANDPFTTLPRGCSRPLGTYLLRLVRPGVFLLGGSVIGRRAGAGQYADKTTTPITPKSLLEMVPKLHYRAKWELHR
jgi:hypothetical protein